jgi:hypothetical protein
LIKALLELRRYMLRLHSAQDSKIVLRVLQKAFRQHAVPRRGRIPR